MQHVARLIVHPDGTRLELDGKTLAWFETSIEAIGAATEHIIWDSAILPELKHLEPLTIEIIRLGNPACHPTMHYRPGLVKKDGRWLRRPCASYRPWLAN